MLTCERSTPFAAEDKRAKAWPDMAIPVYLNEADRERLATKAGLTGMRRNDDACLGRVLKELALAVQAEGAK